MSATFLAFPVKMAVGIRLSKISEALRKILNIFGTSPKNLSPLASFISPLEFHPRFRLSIPSGAGARSYRHFMLNSAISPYGGPLTVDKIYVEHEFQENGPSKFREIGLIMQKLALCGFSAGLIIIASILDELFFVRLCAGRRPDSWSSRKFRYFSENLGLVATGQRRPGSSVLGFRFRPRAIKRKDLAFGTVEQTRHCNSCNGGAAQSRAPAAVCHF